VSLVQYTKLEKVQTKEEHKYIYQRKDSMNMGQNNSTFTRKGKVSTWGRTYTGGALYIQYSTYCTFVGNRYTEGGTGWRRTISHVKVQANLQNLSLWLSM
jgi:hypothetical protein